MDCLKESATLQQLMRIYKPEIKWEKKRVYLALLRYIHRPYATIPLLHTCRRLMQDAISDILYKPGHEVYCPDCERKVTHELDLICWQEHELVKYEPPPAQISTDEYKLATRLHRSHAIRLNDISDKLVRLTRRVRTETHIDMINYVRVNKSKLMTMAHRAEPSADKPWEETKAALAKLSKEMKRFELKLSIIEQAILPDPQDVITID